MTIKKISLDGMELKIRINHFEKMKILFNKNDDQRKNFTKKTAKSINEKTIFNLYPNELNFLKQINPECPDRSTNAKVLAGDLFYKVTEPKDYFRA